MPRNLLYHLFPVLALLALGCDSGVGGKDTRPWCDQPDGPYTGERALYAAYCNAIERCGLGVELGYAFACRQECVQSFDFGLTCGLADDEYDLDRFNRRLEERQAVYDEEQGAECIAWWQAADCADVERILGSDQDSGGETELPEACREVLQIADEGGGPLPGTTAEGEACDNDSDCQPGLFCDRPASNEVEYCQVCLPLPGPGEPCRDYSCGQDAYCDYSVDPDMCVALIADGQPCDNHGYCSSQRCYENVCIAPLADGQSCVDRLQCQSDFCWEGYCMSRLDEGEPCTADAVCISVRCHEGVCITIRQVGEPCEDHVYCWDTCYQGVCSEYRENGESCDEDVNCRSGSVCYEGTCIAANMHPTGAPCDADSDCASGLCLDQVCTDIVEPGQPCTRDEVCASSGICFTDGRCGLPNGEVCWSYLLCRSARCPGNLTCQDPLPDGQPCTAADQCISWECIAGFCHTPGETDAPCTIHEHCERRFFCDPLTMTCQAQVYRGEPCTVDDGCRLGYCDTLVGLCGFPAGDNCQGDGQCQGYCDSTTSRCADLLVDGGSCTRDAQCIGYCVYSRCRASKPFGVECVYDVECEGGICSRDTTRYRCRGPGECFNHPDCEAGAWCNEDQYPYTCAAQKADGESCEEDAECQNYCYLTCMEKKPFGAPCTADEECIDNLCDNGSCSRPGLCWSDSDCPEGQFCDLSLYNPMCSDPKPDGSYCEGDEYCASGWCSPQTETCKVRPSLGDPCQSWECTPDSYCLNGTCAARKLPGADCDDSFYSDAECLAPAICRHGTCQAMPLECVAGEPGEICTFLMVCAPNAYCDLLDNFTCKKRSRVGESCQTLAWGADTCAAGSYCGQGKCAAYAALGESCSDRSCDPHDGYCASGTCRPKKYAGELCTSDSECLGGDCDYQGQDIYRCSGPCKMPD